MTDIKTTAARLFQDAANALDGGGLHSQARIAVAGLGSEIGERAATDACEAAVSKGYRICYIGKKAVPGAMNIKCGSKIESAAEMARVLVTGLCEAAVTMHHTFPTGTATVGRVVTPSRGKEMYIATTSGIPSTDRTESLVLGAIYGIITAKSCGIANPLVGLLDIDGARRAESVLRILHNRGFPIEFAESARADGGPIMRGNDALLGTPDVLVCDPRTGNVLMKILSAYNSGGDRECSGFGYGPGIGVDISSPILIVSRASDTTVIYNAIRFAAEVAIGGITDISNEMLTLAYDCGMKEQLLGFQIQGKHGIHGLYDDLDIDSSPALSSPEYEQATE